MKEINVTGQKRNDREKKVLFLVTFMEKSKAKTVLL